MDRKIKFRAYLKNYNEIYEVISIDFSNEEVLVINKNNDEMIMGFDDVRLLQYTGLKDKNGKEIYEGDVLKQVKKSSREGYESSSYDKNNFEVVFKYGCFWLQRPYSDSVYVRDFPGIDEFVGFECFEIIGNIYENEDFTLKKLKESGV